MPAESVVAPAEVLREAAVFSVSWPPFCLVI